MNLAVGIRNSIVYTKACAFKPISSPEGGDAFLFDTVGGIRTPLSEIEIQKKSTKEKQRSVSPSLKCLSRNIWSLLFNRFWKTSLSSMHRKFIGINQFICYKTNVIEYELMPMHLSKSKVIKLYTN